MRRVQFVSGYLYGAIPFNPKIILLQMMANQAAYYAILSSLIVAVTPLAGYPVEFSYIWSHQQLDLYSSLWELLALIHSLTSILLGIYISWSVERSSKCLDFSLTVFLIHILLTWAFGSFPQRLHWWIVGAFGAVLTSVTSERICRRYEAKEIRIQFVPASVPSTADGTGGWQDVKLDVV